MEKTKLKRLTVVGLFALVLLALVLLLVPGIAAQDGTFDDVGILDFEFPNTCQMINPHPEDPEEEYMFAVDEEVFLREAPGSTFPDNAPEDVVAILKCQNTIEHHAGPKKLYEGDGTHGCLVHFDSSGTNWTITSSWSQTVSAGGKATLICHFKWVPPMN